MFALIRKLGYARVFFFLGENCADANAGDGRLFLHISNPGWQQASSSQSVANGVLTKRASRITKIRTNQRILFRLNRFDVEFIIYVL